MATSCSDIAIQKRSRTNKLIKLIHTPIIHDLEILLSSHTFPTRVLYKKQGGKAVARNFTLHTKQRSIMAKEKGKSKKKGSTSRRGRLPIKVPSCYRKSAEEGVTKYLEEKGLALESTSRPLTGSKNLKENSIRDYDKHYTGLYKFCAMIGDHESLLVLNRKAPSVFCPSMNARTIALYMRYKTCEAGEVLLDENDTEVKDVLGSVVKSVGKWKDPGNLNQFLAAVSAIHAARDQDGQYLEPCQHCVAAYNEDNRSTGCRYHPGEFRIWRRGNPRKSQLVQNVYKQCEDLCSGHVIRGSYQLLPEELMEIRNLCLSTGKLEDLQLWCIILVSIFLFLRHDEFHAIKISDIQRDLSCVTETKIAHLCIKVKGKSDIRPQNLVLWAADDAPLLCPIRHLLTYIHLSGIQDGYLFPNLSDRDKPRCYESLLRTMKSKFSSVLTRNSNLTTHTFRKTAYLLALWGGGHFQSIRTSARHKSDGMGQRYMQDAQFLLENALAIDPNVRHTVPKWKMSIMLNEESGRRLNESTIFTNIHSLSQRFVRLVGIRDDHPSRMNQRFVLKNALEFKEEESIDEKLASLLDGLSIEKKEGVLALFTRQKQSFLLHQQTSTQASALEMDIDTENAAAPPIPSAPSPPDSLPTTNVNRPRRRRGGSITIDRSGVKTKKGMERLEELIRIHEELPEERNELDEGSRNFVIQTVDPIIKCLENHFDGDRDAFIAKWKLDAGISRWKSKCDGSADSSCLT